MRGVLKIFERKTKRDGFWLILYETQKIFFPGLVLKAPPGSLLENYIMEFFSQKILKKFLVLILGNDFKRGDPVLSTVGDLLIDLRTFLNENWDADTEEWIYFSKKGSIGR
ncbi:MAG: hypothetical protein CM15mV12_3460 [uncultured marine virus]|nr:MAG: hypothetical protein CM15mV12_3460 [uncultured marine virus]